MNNLYEEYNIRLNKLYQSNAARNKSDHGDFEQSSAMFDLSDDDDGYERMYERMYSLYNQMVSEMRSGDGGCSKLEIHLVEKN